MMDVEVMTEADRDRQIYELRFKGESLRKIGDQFGLSIAEVNGAIDRCALRIDNAFRARSVAISVDQHDRMKSEAVAMALNKGEQATTRLAAMHAAVKIDYRLGQILGTDAAIKIDPIALIDAGKPRQTSIERISEVINRLCNEQPSRPTDEDDLKSN